MHNIESFTNDICLEVIIELNQETKAHYKLFLKGHIMKYIQ